MSERKPLTPSAFLAALRRYWPGVPWTVDERSAKPDFLIADAAAGAVSIEVAWRGWDDDEPWSSRVYLRGAAPSMGHYCATLRAAMDGVRAEYDAICREVCALRTWRAPAERVIP